MNVLQVQYTSCRRGQSPSSGFQIRNCSLGLSQEELLEIIRLGNYRPPISFDQHGERALDAYPVALRYRQLQSGRYALVHSCYCGRDYTGREGNFMAHTLVAEQGRFPQSATSYLQWPNWKTALAAAEDTEEAPPPLPTIQLEQVAPHAFDGRSFINAISNGESILTELLAALILVRPTNRRIVIRDTADRGWRWLACLLDLLPLPNALGVSLSTYQFDPIDCADVNATVDGTSFTFNQAQRDYEFFVFEPSKEAAEVKVPDRHRELLIEAREHAKTIVRWYLHEPARVGDFGAFMQSFKPCDTDNVLTTGLALFQYAQLPNPTIHVEFLRMVGFVREYTRSDGWPRSIGLLTRALAGRTDNLQFDHIQAVIGLCLDVPEGTEAEALSTAAFKAWLALFFVALGEPDKYAEYVGQYWTELTGKFGAQPGYRLLLAEDQVEILRHYYRQADAGSIKLIAKYLIEAVRSSVGRQIFTHPDLREMCLAAVHGRHPELCLDAISFALTSDEERAALLIYLSSVADLSDLPDSVMPELLRSLATRSDSAGWPLRRRLVDQGLSELVLAEFEGILRSAKKQGEKAKAFSEYARWAQAEIPEYYQANQASLQKSYWRALNESERRVAAWDWLNSKAPPPLDQRLQGEIAVYGNAQLDIDPHNEPHAAPARRIHQIAEAQRLDLQPHRPKIRRLLKDFGGAPSDLALVSQLTSLISDLPSDEYSFVVVFAFQCALPLVKTADEHETLTTRLYDPRFEREFVKSYDHAISALYEHKGRNKQPNVAPLLVAWVHLADEASTSRAAKAVLRRLESLLARWPDQNVSSVFVTARQLAARDRRREPQRYIQMLARVEESIEAERSSLTNSLRRLGRNLLDRANPFKRTR